MRCVCQLFIHIMKTNADYIDDFLKEIEEMVINAIKKPTKEEVVYELGKHLNFHLLKISNQAQKVNEDEKEKIRKILGDTYICERVWSAWEAGTMTKDDFSEASDSEELIDELYDAIS